MTTGYGGTLTGARAYAPTWPSRPLSADTWEEVELATLIEEDLSSNEPPGDDDN